MIYNLYIFDRNGTCVYYGEWNRHKPSTLQSQDEEFKLMYGMIFSIRSFCSRLSPTDCKDGFLGYQTDKYKLHYYETPTGLKFVMNTGLKATSVKDSLHHIYSKIYVETVVRNPLCRLNEPITSQLFKEQLNSYITSLPFYLT